MITNIFLAVLLVTGIVGYDVAHTPIEVEAQEVTTPAPTPTLAPQAKYPPIEEYIRLTFGVYGDRAIQLLTDPICHENRYLDPKAVNDNTNWGGIGRDRGVFQINDIFHPGVNDECAFDYKCNTDYAFRMFKNDDYKFTRWTCGRALGI